MCDNSVVCWKRSQTNLLIIVKKSKYNGARDDFQVGWAELEGSE